MRTPEEQELDLVMMDFWQRLNQQDAKPAVERAMPKVESEIVEIKGPDVERFLADPKFREETLRSPNSNGLGN